MIFGIISFVAGVCLLQWLWFIPDVRWLALSPLSLLFLLLSPTLRWVWALAAGFLWALAAAHLIMLSALDPGLEGKDILIEGTVSSLPESGESHVRFDFDVDRPVIETPSGLFPRRIRLNWYGASQPVRAGERWRLRVRLKRPHGFLNPSGFDYEGWLFRNRIRATGYVRKSEQNRVLGHSVGWLQIQRMREALRSRIRTVMGDAQTTGLVLALTLGDRSGLTPEQWQSFIRSGTNHLVAISGLHIGIVSGLIMLLVLRIWSSSPRLLLSFPALQAASVAALIAALVYAALAGFAIPTQRALIMLAVVLGSTLLRRQGRSSYVLAFALLAVVVWDPFAVLAPGFWLSFGAVTAIYYSVSGRVSVRALSWKIFRMQWIVALGLLPLLALSFARIALTAPVINLAMVPWFSLVIVPLVLLGALCINIPMVGAGLLDVADWLLGKTILVLQTLVGNEDAVYVLPDLPIWVGLPALAGVALLLAPRGLPARWLGIVFVLPIFAWRPGGPETGEIWFTLLDVGQGLSAVIRTQSHTLVYDTGPRFSAEFDTGSAVLLPYLRSQGISTVNRLILSNADNDHTGGAASLIRDIAVLNVASGEHHKLKIAGSETVACRSGQEWDWDSVRFKILHPDDSGHWHGNNASCVLVIENTAGRILLPGDIEMRAERWLLTQQGRQLRADIVLVPHHGSATSSTPEFVSTVNADIALFPVGYRNRYGFPKSAVVERWEDAGAKWYSTATAGAIRLRLSKDGKIYGPDLSRQSRRKYWTHLPSQETMSRYASGVQPTD